MCSTVSVHGLRSLLCVCVCVCVCVADAPPVYTCAHACVCFLFYAELSFLETSALTGENVEEVFMKCARTILAKIDAGELSILSRV